MNAPCPRRFSLRTACLAALAMTATLNSVARADPEADLTRYQPKPYVQLTHPDWCKNAAIYELNTRQFTPKGTFAAAATQLPRLKALGIDIVWLMPIHPIGKLHRKGTLGSPYSVQDYFAVNPDYGTLDDLKAFVEAAHALGLHVILDWVANHTAWDNVWVAAHPEWYDRDHEGHFRPTPWWDWSDIIDLDYNQPELRREMTRALKYWVQEADIDGYRCDVAGYVPVDFWDNARAELDAIKPVFMLAEWEARDLHARAFDMTYAWSWTEAMHKVARGQADTGALFTYYSWNECSWPPNSLRMTGVTNHDMNAWEGTMYEKFGAGLPAAIVLSVVGEGMPLIYNGQEAGNARRLAFFEKDPITWREDPIGELYRKSIALMKRNTALWHAHWGATMVLVPNSAPQQVFSFVRANDRDKVFAVFNFSGVPQHVTFAQTLFPGRYRTVFGDEDVTLDAGFEMDLAPWGYQVFEQR